MVYVIGELVLYKEFYSTKFGKDIYTIINAWFEEYCDDRSYRYDIKNNTTGKIIEDVYPFQLTTID